MSTKPTTFSSAIVNGLLRIPVIVFGLMLGYLFYTWFAVAPADNAKIAERIMADRESIKTDTTSATYALEQRRDICWTAEEKPLTDGLPGAAIIVYNDERAVYVNDPESVDAAFSEALHNFGYTEEPTTDLFDVVALCK